MNTGSVIKGYFYLESYNRLKAETDNGVWNLEFKKTDYGNIREGKVDSTGARDFRMFFYACLFLWFSNLSLDLLLAMADASYKSDLIKHAMAVDALKFGSFTLKSGRCVQL